MNYPFWKRIEDILGATVGLLILVPFIPLIAIAIRIESSGPVFARLDRVSHGKIIKVYKFRSMIEGAPRMKEKLQHLNERTDGPFFKISKDPRVTTTGRFLRRFRIDEFPQLLNVLRGELALVGPRPHEPEEVQGYPREFDGLPKARAGVTGLSQVSGASSLPFTKELELDEFYLKHVSLPLDLKIILKTFKILLSDPSAV